MRASLFEDLKARASLERLRGLADVRVAFLAAASDAAFRFRVRTGCGRPQAYAASMAELAHINATLEGYSPGEARTRRQIAYERAIREGLDDPEDPLAVRLFPSFKQQSPNELA